MIEQYSVLISVYKKENPEYLRAALTSMIKQTIPPYEIIQVCDGPLTEELEQVLEMFSEYLTLVRLPHNCGLGVALAVGLEHCTCEWIVRMDSDDIATMDRCEKQLKYVQQYSDVDVLSGSLAEFTGDALTVAVARGQVISFKSLPATHQEISEYIKYRNPMNHPCVLFRKSKVIEVGSYRSCRFFEDYDLWVRMYQNQCVFANLTDTILYMRVNEMHSRRGGWNYTKAIVCFQTNMYQNGIINLSECICITVLRVVTSLAPNWIRKIVYDRKLRNQ